jgi:hypothetical protein
VRCHGVGTDLRTLDPSLHSPGREHRFKGRMTGVSKKMDCIESLGMEL